MSGPPPAGGRRTGAQRHLRRRSWARTADTIRTFYDEWFSLQGFTGFANDALFQAFADGVSADVALYEAKVF